MHCIRPNICLYLDFQCLPPLLHRPHGNTEDGGGVFFRKVKRGLLGLELVGGHCGT